MTVTLHIGASKCGSSAIQTALTADPIIARQDGSNIHYIALDVRNDRLIEGRNMVNTAGVYRYKSSPSAKNLVAAPLEGISRAIKKHSSDLLLSSEGWLFEPKHWETILDRLDLDVNVVVYVRPQVQVLNSAWWQWGAWSDAPFDDWMAARLKSSMWAARIRKWKRIKRVREIMVRPVPSDIIPDFYRYVLNAKPPDMPANPNPSLPGPVLRLFQRNRSLRPSIHASRIDFVLAEALSMTDESIWVLDEKWIQRILEATRADNEDLLSFMGEDCARTVRDDPRWKRRCEISPR